MAKTEIRRHIDDGANDYLRLLGDAEHMEYISNGYYSMIRPKPGEEGGTSLFNIRLEHLSDAELEQKVAEIKALNLHTWWGLCISERMQNAIWNGQQRPQPLPEPNDEEGYMAMLPEEKPSYAPLDGPITIKKVECAEDFRIWAGISNQVLHGGYPIMHPKNHYHLCESGVMPCYLGYWEKTPAATAAVMNNQDNASLEFVATLVEFRKKGLAKAVCVRAIEDAFENRAKIITLRSLPEAKKLYLSLGFQIY